VPVVLARAVGFLWEDEQLDERGETHGNRADMRARARKKCSPGWGGICNLVKKGTLRREQG